VGALKEVRVPDIGDFEEVEVIEVLIAPGDVIAADASVVTLESDKATMEVPCPWAGVVTEVRVGVGDRVSEGTVLLVIDAADAAAGAEPVAAAPQPPPEAPRPAVARPAEVPRAAPPVPSGASPPARPRSQAGSHASPSVRRFARELGVDIALVRGSGRKQRVRKEDVQQFVKQALAGGAPIAIPDSVVQVEPAPAVDFARFGEIEVQPLGNVRRLAAANLRRSWLSVPHVTQHDEADITDLEARRREQTEAARERGVKLTVLAYLLQATAQLLREFPRFGASLAPDGENLILKKYVHIGVAVDTPVGLVVPVVRDVDRKDVFEVAAELADLSERGRARRLRPAELQGGCISISSLGGIGGTAFTPIVNSPEVAILGVSRHDWRPVLAEGVFVPRLMLPLSLSYDHRVIDGADGARFTTRLRELLGDAEWLAALVQAGGASG
jgi:pyruvate dehydrogenase E2 component (dihydrolipoamide acetyltransferase)